METLALQQLLSNGSMSDDCDINVTLALHSHWIYVSFGQCVENVTQYFSFFIGLVSIFSWMCAQIPQIVVNCKTGKADASLSFWFLLLWVFSDSANFLGAIFAKQLMTQIILGGYFVLMDLICLAQFLFHFFRNRRRGYKRLGVRGYLIPKKMKSDGSEWKSLLMLLFPCALLLYGHTPRPDGHSFDTTRWKGRALLTTDDPIIDVHDSEFMVGYVLGWIASVIYFFALPPQIIKNFRRKSVSGVSLVMFLFVTVGDASSFISVFIFKQDKAYIVRTLPWTSGSAWSFFFDVILVVQILVYKRLGRDHPEELSAAA